MIASVVFVEAFPHGSPFGWSRRQSSQYGSVADVEHALQLDDTFDEGKATCVPPFLLEDLVGHEKLRRERIRFMLVGRILRGRSYIVVVVMKEKMSELVCRGEYPSFYRYAVPCVDHDGGAAVHPSDRHAEKTLRGDGDREHLDARAVQ